MNNMKPPQVASPPPVIKSSEKVKPPQVIKQSIEVKVPPPPQTHTRSESQPQKSDKGSEWTIIVLIILTILVVVAVAVYFIAKDKNELTQYTTSIIDQPTILPDGIELDIISLSFMNTGESMQLKATVHPINVADKNKKVIWMSDNEKVATVNENGIVAAVATGNAVISAYTANGFSATCNIRVGNENASEVTNTIVKQQIEEQAKKVETAKPPQPENKKAPYTPAQLNDLLNKIKKSDDNATDKIRKLLGNTLRVEGAPNISNVQQLITDISNGSHYKVTKVNTNAEGKVISISVSK